MRACVLRLWRIGATGLLALACPGCGLLFVPRVQVFPGDVHGIRVVDARDGRDLPRAALIYEVWPHDNWFHAGAQLREPESTCAPRECGSEPYRRLEVRRDADAVFRVESCRTLGWMQWFFPVPSPLGWNLYHDYEARVTVRAPGYCGLLLVYTPDCVPAGRCTGPTTHGNCDLTSDGILEFSLLRAE